MKLKYNEQIVQESNELKNRQIFLKSWKKARV